MKTLSWNDNWFIDVDDIDENNVTISGNSDTPNNVWVKFEAGVTQGEYIITYNDGERCLQQEVSAITPCSCTVTSSYPPTSAHTSAAETSTFTVGTINESNCQGEVITIVYVEEDSNGDWLSCNSLEIDENNNITSSGISENTSSDQRYATYSFSCGGTLNFYQKGCDCNCNNVTWGGTQEADPQETDPNTPNTNP